MRASECLHVSRLQKISNHILNLLFFSSKNHLESNQLHILVSKSFREGLPIHTYTHFL